MRGIPYQPYQIVHAQLRLFKSVGAVGAGSGSKWIHVDHVQPSQNVAERKI